MDFVKHAPKVSALDVQLILWHVRHVHQHMAYLAVLVFHVRLSIALIALLMLLLVNNVSLAMGYLGRCALLVILLNLFVIHVRRIHPNA